MKKILLLIFIFFTVSCACKAKDPKSAQSLVTFEEAVKNSSESLQDSKVIYVKRLRSSPSTIPNGQGSFL